MPHNKSKCSFYVFELQAKNIAVISFTVILLVRLLQNLPKLLIVHLRNMLSTKELKDIPAKTSTEYGT